MSRTPGVRLQLLHDLVAHFRGPENGRDELLDTDPRTHYLVGVLAPEPHSAEETAAEAPPEEPATLGEGAAESEEDQDDGDVGPSPISPVLAPDRLSRSIGLTVAVPAGAELRFAVSWAIYSREKSGWHRRPRAVVLPQPVTAVDGLRHTVHLGASGPVSTPEQGAEVTLHVSARRAGQERIMVTAHMINAMRERAELSRRDSERHVYQPQIRVLCDRELLPVTPAESGDLETRRLAFLHRHLAPMARGHLCSAVWRRIDPERTSPGGDPGARDPFVWIDGTLLEENEREKFSPPDARTELVPALQVSAPTVGWPQGYSPEPELSAALLAESPRPEELRRKLEPLVDAYREWVEQMERDLEVISREERPIALELIGECRDVLRRMEDGLRLLGSDRDIWLSFCFACRAMDLQYLWSRGEHFFWRPFQVAFLLACLESTVKGTSAHRDVCDLLWVPTGSGKTEAYLGLAVFTMAWRRRRALSAGTHGAGTCVISRYTLRLLTVQQFRRALRLITACEYLRVYGAASGAPIGWRPEGCGMSDDFLWGTARFSIGLWVGGNVTPNRLRTIFARGKNPVRGAIEILTGNSRPGTEGDPAQVIDCPACGTILAAGELAPGDYTLHWVVSPGSSTDLEDAVRSVAPPEVRILQIHTHRHVVATETVTLSVSFRLSGYLPDVRIDEWLRAASRGTWAPLCARGSRPGYFVRTRPTGQGRDTPVDFDVFCPNPACPLNSDVLWMEGTPSDASAIELLSRVTGRRTHVISRELPGSAREMHKLRLPSGRTVHSPDGLLFRGTPRLVWPPRVHRDDLSLLYLSTRIPIPAYTVDEQVYGRCPTMVIATADKFARLPFEPRAAALFGNVNRYHPVIGYFREGLKPDEAVPANLTVQVPPLDPPDLIVQDELHLLEGPLGSLAGLYEIATDTLCAHRGGAPGPKYVAATATTRNSRDQVAVLFARKARLFPPHGIRPEDRFFVRGRIPDARDEETPGQLYVGLCTPGRGPLTPLLRSAARLMQTVWEIRNAYGDGPADPYWTLVLYFNAVRELAGARSLYLQDIPEWLNQRLAPYGSARPILSPPEEPSLIELSSRRVSSDLPRVLAQLETRLPGQATDALLTTSMFGTGVDVPRLSLMLVQGQPKTTSAYIQATGRVGRSTGALVVTLLRASRPRDLSHYEFFCGYHARLHSFVEPVPVMPFSDGAMDRVCGPVAVAILRNIRPDLFGTDERWHLEEGAALIRERRADLGWLEELFVQRARCQPPALRPQDDEVRLSISGHLDRWKQMATVYQDLRFVEYTFGHAPEHHVVLGEPSHTRARKCVCENTPQSLRDVEESVVIVV